MIGDVGGELLQALSFAFGMFWEVLWALILGFAISAAVQAVVSKRELRKLVPDDSPRSVTIACGLGAASSSCSNAAVAMAKSLVRRGADFTSATAFEFASTNLVIELGIIMAILLGRQFTLAEFIGGPLLIIILALLFRRSLGKRLVDEARRELEHGRVGSIELLDRQRPPRRRALERRYELADGELLLGAQKLADPEPARIPRGRGSTSPPDLSPGARREAGTERY